MEAMGSPSSGMGAAAGCKVPNQIASLFEFRIELLS